MKKTTKALLIKLAGGIVAVSAATGGVAFVKDRIDEKNEKRQITFDDEQPTHKMGFYERFIKRPLDCTLSTGAALVFSPILLTIAVLVRLKLGSPVLFTQDRLGKDARVFKLYKFRSMTDERDPQTGELMPDDVRLTSFGRKLRSTSLDELPELFNIIKGDMAVVGPRPLLVKYLPYYTAQERHRHDVRPGLTGLAQINGRNNAEWRDKLANDVKYARNITFLGDVRIILTTINKVVKRSDVRIGKQISVKGFMEERQHWELTADGAIDPLDNEIK